ncbi:Mss4-like protein [Rhodofomes roseus]|uniref:Mss4-like protein n=1 Tax=Rhodofomes roseus TaxID=34475 RepID=A0ABQ8KJW1_9APHY|nr:Mss4-like protein [Rhodofomes roseus]KAH9838371.1 Mss4-like protein [Rhodofomes roseus]
MSTNGRVRPNVHPEAPVHKGSQSHIPHPPPEDHPKRDTYQTHEIADTGWRGELPSKQGGTYEKDYMHKPPYEWKGEDDLFKPKYYSQCWCGHVAFEFHGDPLDAKHCHCRQCQRLHGAPFQWAVIFPKTSVRMVRNEATALHFLSTEDQTAEHSVPCKVSCNVCRSPMFDEGRNTVLAYPSSFRFKDAKVPLDFQPTAHIFYSQRVMDVPDGVPKWSGHKGESELIQEMEDEEGTLPKYKGKQDSYSKVEKEDKGPEL